MEINNKNVPPIWYFICADTCKKNKEFKSNIINKVNNRLETVDKNSRISCITYNNSIYMLYDCYYDDFEYMNPDTVVFKDKKMSIYELLGDIFIKILDTDTKYKNIVCKIFAYTINRDESVYSHTAIEKLFNLIIKKYPEFLIEINLVDNEIINIKNKFEFDIKPDCEDQSVSPKEPSPRSAIARGRFSYTKSNRSDSDKKTSGKGDNDKKSIYFNIHIKN